MKTGDWMVAYGAEGVGQADEDPVDLLVNRISKKATLALDRALEGEKIGYRQWLVLSEIHETPGTTARTIAAHLGHDTGALSRIIDVLCERGLANARAARKTGVPFASPPLRPEVNPRSGVVERCSDFVRLGSYGFQLRNRCQSQL